MNGFWEFFWFAVSCFVLFAYLMVFFNILTDLFRDRDTSGLVKAVWVVALIFVPFLSALVYLIVRGPAMAERSRQVADAQSKIDGYVREAANDTSSPSDEIGRAKTLLDAGTISQAEFEALKTKAMQ